MSIYADTLELFNAVVIRDDQRDKLWPDLLDLGIVLDFIPDVDQLAALKVYHKPLDVITLFSKEERLNASVNHLLFKQMVHYIEVYGLDAPGLFDLEVNNGQIARMHFIHGMTRDELNEKVQALLYGNAPVKDAAQLERIVEDYGVEFDLNLVANNELRVRLWSVSLGQRFQSGDDAMRYLVLRATGSSMLIKSHQVIAKLKALDTAFVPLFLEMHIFPLAQVFNRHKALLLALKDKNALGKSILINRISRLSKTAHVPVRESIQKTFIAKALAGQVKGDVLDKVSVRDKMKYLNLLAEKRLQRTFAMYRVRNGKIWYTEDGTVWGLEEIARVEDMVLTSLGNDLAELSGKHILLDPEVDYGLPVSRKQTLGRLPFGTRVSMVTEGEISAGMYWENDWGARDLDLSAVRSDGARIGWCAWRGYDDNGVIFSGDVTSAPNGAMEFMTSRNQDYALYVNIYYGDENCELEIVVGEASDTKKQWMDRLVLREKHKLESNYSILGFVRGKTFVIYGGRLGNRIVSGKNPTLQMIDVPMWTTSELLAKLGIDFDVDMDINKEYDHDLSYDQFSFDKLEDLFKTSC